MRTKAPARKKRLNKNKYHKNGNRVREQSFVKKIKEKKI
jgi:hypothetical protein